MMNYYEVLNELKSLRNPENIKKMSHFGVVLKNAYGISAPELKKLAKKIGKNHNIAKKLWESDIHDAKILACLIDNPKELSEEEMDYRVNGIYSWDLCDAACRYTFCLTDYAYKKVFEWSKREEEFVKRAAFSLIAYLSIHDKKADDEKFLQFLPLIKREASDNRNFVKKAVNWALRQIGKRNVNLNAAAIQTAEEIKDETKSRWIASDALRELKSEKIQNRLRK